MTNINHKLSQYWFNVQEVLFPFMKEEKFALTEKLEQLIRILELIKVEDFIEPIYPNTVGRPAHDRRAIARAFVSKSVLKIPNTNALIDRLRLDSSLRRICGWEYRRELPSETIFSRAFAEFASSDFPNRVHKVLIGNVFSETMIMHVSRDATQIKGREKPAVQKQEKAVQPRKVGRPKKGEERPAKEPKRLQKQQTQTLDEMLAELPKACNSGCKRNSKGYQESWNGYKLHIDAIDGQIPVTCLLTSASVHDSQVAIPLAKMTSEKFTSFYDLMDAAYDCPEIHSYCEALNHKPIIDINPRTQERKKEILEEEKRFRYLNFTTPEAVRFNNRSNVERVNSRLKDDFGANFVRVRGHAKVFCHLMFGILALAADQILKLAT